MTYLQPINVQVQTLPRNQALTTLPRNNDLPRNQVPCVPYNDEVAINQVPSVPRNDNLAGALQIYSHVVELQDLESYVEQCISAREFQRQHAVRFLLIIALM
jgi:hypothetical protein